MDRYNRVVRHHIVCTLCNSQELGREYHYLFNYSYCLSEIRQYVNQHVYRYPNILNLCVCVRTRVCVYLVFSFAFDFCRFCVVIRFSYPRHNGQLPPTSQDFHSRYYPFVCCLILNKKEPIFPFIVDCWYYWYHFLTTLV